MSEMRKIYNRLLKAYGPQHWWPGETPFEVMVGAILTQSTSWTNVEKSILLLKSKGLMSAKKMNAVRTPQLASLVKSSGYFNQKAKKIKHFLAYFMKVYGGSIARMKEKNLTVLREELLAVHGIGPETADSILLYALEKPIFVTDAYTHRIFSRLGRLKEGATYDDAQALFMRGLKRDVKLYNEYHALIVRHGKVVCKKSKPRCSDCCLQKDCDFGRRAV